MKHDIKLDNLRTERDNLHEKVAEAVIARDSARKQYEEFKSLRDFDIDYLHNEFKIISDLENIAKENATKCFDKDKDRIHAGMYSAIKKGYASQREAIRKYQDDIILEVNRLKKNFIKSEDNFKELQVKLKIAINDFNDRRQIVLGNQEQQLQYHSTLAKHAGVPECYMDNFMVSTEAVSGKHQIYFGGRGRPDGLGHGHYCVHNNGTIEKYREANSEAC